MVSRNPVKLGYDEPLNLKFVNAERTLNVKLKHYVKESELLEFMPQVALSSWEKSPEVKFSDLQKAKTLRNVLTGKTLPAAKRFINFTWYFDHISMQEVTHILRQRGWTFVAQCSDTMSWRTRDILVPDAIMQSPDLYEDFKNAVYADFKVYAALADTREVNLMDARHVLPRAASTFYWVQCNMQDAMAFIYDRISVEFQPQLDNIMAYQMALQIEKAYPLATGIFDLDKVASYYPSMIYDHGRTYPPREKARKMIPDDVYENLDFAYDKVRNEYRGTNKPKQSAYEEVRDALFKEVEDIRIKNRMAIKKQYGVTLEELDNMPSYID